MLQNLEVCNIYGLLIYDHKIYVTTKSMQQYYWFGNYFYDFHLIFLGVTLDNMYP